MHPHAYHALRAAKHGAEWGAFATLRYTEKRGVPFRLLELALRLEIAQEDSFRCPTCGKSKLAVCYADRCKCRMFAALKPPKEILK